MFASETNLYPEEKREKTTIGNAGVVRQTGAGSHTPHLKPITTRNSVTTLMDFALTRLPYRAQRNLLSLVRDYLAD